MCGFYHTVLDTSEHKGIGQSQRNILTTGDTLMNSLQIRSSSGFFHFSLFNVSMEFFLFRTEGLRIEAVVWCTDCVLWGKCWAIEMTVNTCLFCSNYGHHIDVRKDDTFIWVCCVWWDIVSEEKPSERYHLLGLRAFLSTSQDHSKLASTQYWFSSLCICEEDEVKVWWRGIFSHINRGLFPAVLVMVYKVWPRANKNLPISPFQWHICVCVYLCWYENLNLQNKKCKKPTFIFK